MAATDHGTPVRVGDVASVRLAPDVRRGVADLDGRGDVVGGIVVMRYGENALATIDRVKEKLEEIEAGMPEGREASTRSRLAETLERQGAIEQARVEHDAAVAAPGANAGTLFARGMFHLRQRRESAAIADLEQAARLDPAWPAPREALRRLGR